MYHSSLLILGQVLKLQLQLNETYLDSVEIRRLSHTNRWASDKDFRQKADALLKSVVRIQDAVFSVYNAGYELTVRSR